MVRKRYGISILILLLFVTLIVGVVAKYVYENQGRNLIVAKEFYFTSNLLVEGGKNYVLNPNSEEITFTLGNNADALRFSEDAIAYEITVEGGAVISQTKGTLENGGVSVDKITLSELETGKTYTVTATGKAGYKKVISASFTVGTNNKAIYKYLDATNDAYVLLTVWAENLTGDVTVAFPAGIIPDNTDLIMRSVQNYTNETYNNGEFVDTESFQVNYASRTYRFFIDDAENITADQFVVELQDEESKSHLAGKETPK